MKHLFHYCLMFPSSEGGVRYLSGTYDCESRTVPDAGDIGDIWDDIREKEAKGRGGKDAKNSVFTSFSLLFSTEQ